MQHVQYVDIWPRGPLTYFNDRGRGGQSDFLGLKFWPTLGDFLGSIKDAGIFLGHEKKQRNFFGLQKKN